MRKRKLGNTDLELTVMGFGAWAIGGGNWEFSWGPQDDKKSIDAIHKALDLGINWVDTAAIYGLGHSEEVVAQALEGRRNDVIVATKCSMRWDDNREIYRSLNADSIRKECENSLRRLRTDYIDLYQIHWPNPEDDIEEGWDTLNQLKREGKIRWAGVSNFDVMQMDRVSHIAPISSLQPPYNLLHRDTEEKLLPYCRENNIGVVAYSPMGSGLLTGKYTREKIAQLPPDDHRPKYNRNFQMPKLERNLKLIEELKELAAEDGHTVAQLAVAWVLRRPEVTSAIVGGRTPQQVEGTAPAGDWELHQETVDRIDNLIHKYDL